MKSKILKLKRKNKVLNWLNEKSRVVVGSIITFPIACILAFAVSVLGYQTIIPFGLSMSLFFVFGGLAMASFGTAIFLGAYNENYLETKIEKNEEKIKELAELYDFEKVSLLEYEKKAELDKINKQESEQRSKALKIKKANEKTEKLLRQKLIVKLTKIKGKQNKKEIVKEVEDKSIEEIKTELEMDI